MLKTVSLILSSNTESKTKEAHMIDKIHLRSNIVADRSAIHNFSRETYISSFKVRDKNYGDCVIFKKKGEHILTIKSLPSLSRNWPIWLEFNPSKFDSYELLLDTLKRLKIDICEAQIRRIDHCADMTIDLDSVASSLIVKNKRKRTDYAEKDKVTGIYFGKGLEVINIYNKREHLKKKGDLSFTNEITRFEVRHKGKKVHYHSLVDLDKYLSFDPFEKLQFYNIEIQKHTSLTFRDKYFLELVNERSLHSASKILNSNNNFKRDYQARIKPNNYSSLLTEKYHEGLYNFLKES